MSGILGGAKSQSQAQTAVSDLQVQTSTFGAVVPIMWGTTRLTGNLIWYGNFQSHAQSSSQSSGGKGGGGGGGSTTSYTYSTSFAIGLCEGQIQSIGTVYASKDTGTVSSYGFSVFMGSVPQSPWSYLSSAFPAQAIGYTGLCYIAAANYDLGSNTSMPNFSFQVSGKFANSFNSSPDAPPASILPDYLDNPYYGVGFPLTKLASLAQWDAFTKAYGILVSPLLDTAQQATQFVDDLCTATCSAAVWASTQLKIIPYADVAYTGNGVTFTPSVTPVYNLTDDDFLDDGSTDPVTVKRINAADAYNSVTVEYLDSTNEYNVATVTAQDQANIDLYGLRQKNAIQMHMITLAAVAQQVAQFQVQRSCYVRNQYTFTLGWRHCLLEPMDVVTINDAWLGLSSYPVRIIEVDEDESGQLKVTAEDFPDQVSTPSLNQVAAATRYAANYNVDPGPINTPVIFDAPGILTASGYEIWAAISGGSLFGGAGVWVSEDGNTYVNVGAINGGARYGALSAALPVGADPDTTDTAAVNLSVSGGTMLSGTLADANAYNTLCLIDGELISYETAALTAANQYNLTYLRRGVYGTPNAAHASGAPFTRLDQAIFKYAYNPALLGKSIYLKFTAFNLYGGGEESLANSVAYTHVIGGSISKPSNITGFMASQNGNVVVMQWNLPTDPNIAGYEIRYTTQGDTTWSHGTPISQVTAGTQITTAKLAPGNWTLLMCAQDNSGVYSASPAAYNITMLNVNTLLYTQQQAPDWTAGTLTNFVHHWSGVLAPQCQGVAANDGWSTFDQYANNPYPTCTYQSPQIDLGIDASVRLHGEIASILGPGAPGIAAPALQMQSRLSAGTYQGFQPWTIGTQTCRYVQMEFLLNTAVGLPVIQGFTPSVDGQPFTQSGQAVIPAGGATITFPLPYHPSTIPIPQVTAVGGSGLVATVSASSATSMTVHVFNTSNVDVGGTVNWTVNGE